MDRYLIKNKVPFLLYFFNFQDIILYRIGCVAGMKIMLMDASKLVNLVLPKDIFGNYWIVNDRKENLVNVEAVDNNWVLKSNSEVKVFRNGTAVEETLLEEEKFYTITIIKIPYIMI